MCARELFLLEARKVAANTMNEKQPKNHKRAFHTNEPRGRVPQNLRRPDAAPTKRYTMTCDGRVIKPKLAERRHDDQLRNVSLL